MDKSKLFDQKIRDAVNKYEVPFDDSAWKNIESKINVQPKAKIINWKAWLISTAAAAALLVGYFVMNPSSDEITGHAEKQKTEVIKPIEREKIPDNDNSIVDESSNSEGEEENELLNEEEEINSRPERLPLIEDESSLIQSNIDVAKVEDSKEEINNQEFQLDNNDDTESSTEQLALSVNINKEVLCENEQVRLVISRCNIPVELSWDFGDGELAEGSTVSHVYEEAGSYQIKMTARSVLDEELISTENYSIVVNPSPQAEFDIDKSENMAAYPEVTFSSLSEQVSDIEWKFAGKSVQNASVVDKLYRKKGSYSIGLIVKNQFQCSDTLYRNLVIQHDFNLLAPNAFSPNGDGINDTFIPQALPYLNQGFTLQVFEPKTGQLIFESSDFTIPWNGNIMNNGNKMADGAYAWSVITDDGSVYKGTILITTE